jgi:hypothetical protein
MASELWAGILERRLLSAAEPAHSTSEYEGIANDLDTVVLSSVITQVWGR